MLTKEDYKGALNSQTACNASALVKSLAEVTPRIWEEARANNKGTDYVNKHPIMVLYITQLSSLTGLETTWNGMAYADAYNACERGAA